MFLNKEDNEEDDREDDKPVQFICDVTGYVCVGYGKGVLYVDTETNRGFTPKQLFGTAST